MATIDQPTKTHASLGNGPCITIRGARMHNLGDLDLQIPRNQMVVITGPSGSGKSSLAFDTLYAEGQRQYIESLSAYARQFLNQLERPDVDIIEGLQPTICIDQRPGAANPRSTVATVTEIYDYLRLLMARLGEPSCYQCGAEISQQSTKQIQDRLMSLPEGTRAMIMAPIIRGRRGQHKELLQKIKQAGFVRARIDGTVYDVDSFPELAARKVHHIDVVIDRVIIREGIKDRVGESVRLALDHGEGLAVVCYFDTVDATVDSTDGDWKDILFSTLYACPNCDINYEEVEPRTFSFNSPYGACSGCGGLGHQYLFDEEFVIPDLSLSIEQGAITALKGAPPKVLKKHNTQINRFLKLKQLDRDTPLCEFGDEKYKKFIHGIGKTYIGLFTLLEQELVTATGKKRLAQLESYRGSVLCPDCNGSRLRPEANSVRLDGLNIDEITKMAVGDAHEFFDRLKFSDEDRPISDPIISEIIQRLTFLKKVGVSYLALNRPADTLSGGELQRVRLASSIGSALVGVCYILDEPSIGLHQRDNNRLIDSLRDLQRIGNTVIVVEHDDAMMREADWVIDMGPGAGQHGGSIVVEGPPDDVIACNDSLTGLYLSGSLQIEVPADRRPPDSSKSLVIDGVETNNLQQVVAEFPLGTLICVTGVSGSGKSSLVNETLAPALLRYLGLKTPKPGPHNSLTGTELVDKVVMIDQSPIGRTPRSNAATYTGVLDEIRKVFANTRDAKQRGFKANRFSFNVKAGRCAECEGQGVQKVEMNFLPDLYVICSQCHGARYNRQTLQVRYRGKSIADVLDMSVDQGVEFFENFSVIQRTLQSMKDVGLGYLRLGQSSTTLSGGEAQRIKLASQLSRVDTGQTVYILDEPTTGLHFDDIRKLLLVLGKLVDRGNTVIVIEHNLDVVKVADWIIDLGPEGGEGGGHVVATGTPEEIASNADSITGRFLRELL